MAVLSLSLTSTTQRKTGRTKYREGRNGKSTYGRAIGYIPAQMRRQQKYSNSLQTSDRVNLRFVRGILWDPTWRRVRVGVTAFNGCGLPCLSVDASPRSTLHCLRGHAVSRAFSNFIPLWDASTLMVCLSQRNHWPKGSRAPGSPLPWTRLFRPGTRVVS